MRGWLSIAVLALGFLARAEIIDRIAVTVGTQVITASGISREIRMVAFMNGDIPDLSPESRRKAAGRLVEQKLVRREMELGRYPDAPASDVDAMLAQFRRSRYRSDAEYRAALSKYGITEEDLKSYLLWQRTFLRFIELRFRTGVQVSDEDIRNYYEKELPALRAGGRNTVSLDALRDKIQETLTDQRVDRELDTWLKQTRKNTRIQFHEDAFQPAAPSAVEARQ